MTKSRIIVVGSINVDLVVRCQKLPTPGETVLGGEFLRTLGGKGANQAVAAARLGTSSPTFIALVGDDDLAATRSSNWRRSIFCSITFVRSMTRPRESR